MSVAITIVVLLLVIGCIIALTDPPSGPPRF